jgi:hypothetical protein
LKPAEFQTATRGAAEPRPAPVFLETGNGAAEAPMRFSETFYFSRLHFNFDARPFGR